MALIDNAEVTVGRVIETGPCRVGILGAKHVNILYQNVVQRSTSGPRL